MQRSSTSAGRAERQPSDAADGPGFERCGNTSNASVQAPIELSADLSRADAQSYVELGFSPSGNKGSLFQGPVHRRAFFCLGPCVSRSEVGFSANGVPQRSPDGQRDRCVLRAAILLARALPARGRSGSTNFLASSRFCASSCFTFRDACNRRHFCWTAIQQCGGKLHLLCAVGGRNPV